MPVEGRRLGGGLRDLPTAIMLRNFSIETEEYMSSGVLVHQLRWLVRAVLAAASVTHATALSSSRSTDLQSLQVC